MGIPQIATIYRTALRAFLAVGSLLGLFMRRLHADATSMTVEHRPVNATGFMSRISQQGYNFTYVSAAYANLGIGESNEP